VGLDLILVGLFDFKNVAYYAVAAGLVNFMVGLQYSIFNAMISPAAALHARGEFEKLGAVVVTATRYGMFLLLITGLPLIFGANFILTKWVGAAYSAKAAPLLQILVLANIIRMSAVPYAMALIASGQQRFVIVCPLLEGFSNLLFSVALGRRMGAEGVAYGTLIGAIVSVIVHWFYNIPHTTGEITLKSSEYLYEGLFVPLICASPIIFTYSLGRILWQGTPTTWLSALTISGLIAGLLVWTKGLTPLERKGVQQALLNPISVPR
jgi:O-antigen/teichoic acid export membrane protein